jgi:hypothetical protein
MTGHRLPQSHVATSDTLFTPYLRDAPSALLNDRNDVENGHHITSAFGRERTSAVQSVQAAEANEDR